MATVSKSFTENFYSSYKSTWTLALSGADVNVTAEGQNIKLAHPTLTAKYVYSSKSYGSVVLDGKMYARGILMGTIGKAKESSSGAMVKMTSGTVYTIANATESTNGNVPVINSIAASRLFDSNNPTVNSIPITATSAPTSYEEAIFLESGCSAGADDNNKTEKYNGYPNGSPTISWGTIGTIYYKVPPTINSATVTKNTSRGYFKGITTVTVNVAALAKYGGYISTVKLTIGSQTVSRSGNGSLSIVLAEAGTFTPVVTVTDSRGQTATKSLSAITVNDYAAPSAELDLERTDAYGVESDEGTHAVVKADIRYTAAAGNLLEPTLKVEGTTKNITWYSDRSLSTQIDWSNYNPTSPTTIYGYIGDTFSVNYGYQISLIPRDTFATGEEVSQQLGSAFYTMYVLAGGHGVAFGQICSAQGLYFGMETYFKRAVDGLASTPLRDFFYPVGTCYETYDTSFDPGDQWGGTWTLVSSSTPRKWRRTQ